jgi:hydrogenase/urease accessory protein HupE
MEGDCMKNARKFRLPLYSFVVFTFFMYALPADAHLNSTGMGPFYDGLMHFLMSPEDIVPVLALALLAGLRGASYGRRALFTLPIAWLLGGLAGLSAMTMRPHPLIAAAWFLLLGGLLAADAKVSLRLATALAALLGLYHGYLNGVGMGQFDTAAVAILGLVFAVFVLIALAAAVVVRLRSEWARIAVRVAGSWIAASGLLMLGWAVRTR